MLCSPAVATAVGVLEFTAEAVVGDDMQQIALASQPFTSMDDDSETEESCELGNT